MMKRSRGKTPEAIRVAQNHARIVSKFAKHGWGEHDREHAAVVDWGPARFPNRETLIIERTVGLAQENGWRFGRDSVMVEFD